MADSPASGPSPASPATPEAKTMEEDGVEASDTPLDLPNIADYIAESVQARVDAAVAEMTATLGDLESWKAESSRLLQEQLRAVDALPHAVPNEPENDDLPVERPVLVRCVVVSPPFRPLL
jgi:hypothetical protein